MDFRPPNLLLLLLLLPLTSHLLFVQCDTGQSVYTIDDVDLSIQPSTTVHSGEAVTIGCKVTVSHTNIPNLSHTFEIKRDGAIIHSSTTTDDSVAHELNPARAADSGVYDCRVTVKDKNKGSPNLKLNVIGLQVPILYLSKTTLYKDEEFQATCSAPGEKGLLVFSFFQIFQNKAPEKIAKLPSTGNSSETTLVLTHRGNYTLYCDYELVLGARHSNHSNKIEVEVKEAQISLSMDVKPHHQVYEGDLLEVGCIVTTPLKNVEVFLKINNNILFKSYGSFIRQFRIYESGNVTCKAEWNSVQKQTEHEIKVKELFSKPNLALESDELFEGDRMILECSVPRYARERLSMERMKFFIYRNDRQITTSQNYNAVARTGNYTCKAVVENSQSKIVKESQALVVKPKIPVSPPVLSVVGNTLVLGKSFQVLCSSDRGSLPITYTLRRADVKADMTRVVSTPGEQAIFNCSPILERSTLKNFICHANNSRNRAPEVANGIHRLNSTTIIDPVSEPVLTVSPNMGDVEEGQDVTLLCSVRKGTLPIIFTWYHTEQEDFLSSQSSLKLRASLTRSIKGGHKGGYYCTSTNPANETKKSQTVMIRVKMAAWKKGLIAVLCILLILALVLVVAFKTRFLHFKRKRTDGLSVKSASTKVERLSLTQAEVNEAANATPSIMGKSVWSDQASGSETDDQNSVTDPEPQYKEVKISQADPNGVPVEMGTGTATYNEVRNSKQGVPEQADGTSVEYAQLNHDANHYSEHSEHGNFSVQDEHVDTIDNSVDTGTADHGE